MIFEFGKQSDNNLYCIINLLIMKFKLLIFGALTVLAACGGNGTIPSENVDTVKADSEAAPSNPEEEMPLPQDTTQSYSNDSLTNKHGDGSERHGTRPRPGSGGG
jgi:hypothetical protein